MTKILSYLPVLIPILVAFNVILGGIGQFLHALNKQSAESIVGKIAGLLKKIIDLAQGNLAH